jgi:hypothetical protein
MSDARLSSLFYAFFMGISKNFFTGCGFKMAVLKPPL